MQIEFVSSRHLADSRWETDGVLVVMPFTQAAEARRTAQILSRRAGADGLILGVFDEGLGGVERTSDDIDSNAGRAGFVSIVNAAFRASSSPWFCYLAQDAFPGRQWMSIALAALQRKEGHLAAFNDGKWHGQLASFGLARRTWIEALYDGDFFFGGYERHYADVELTVLALAEKALVYAPESVLVEVDWEKDNKPVSQEDRSLYLRRAKSGFNGRVADAALLGRFK